MSPGSRLAAYIRTLTLVGGDHDGQPFTVLSWEDRFLRGAFRQPGDSALSVARGNGKSALVAGTACAVVDPSGPLHGPRREAVCVASSFAQARIIFEDALAALEAKYPKLREPKGEWRIQDSANTATITHRASGARLRCIGSDPKRAHGLRPVLVLADEPAQWPEHTGERMVAALRTGLGKVPGSRLIALGTRPADSAHWFEKMLSGGAAYAQVHAADLDAPPFQVRSLRKANPSWGHLPSLRLRVLEERKEAKRDPAMLASWRALRLNQGVADVVERVLLDPDTWERIEVEYAPRTGHYVLGLDLGASAAMSAAAAYWPETGGLDAFAVFPELPDLRARGLRDGVGRLYADCARRGELLQLGQRVSDVAGLLRECLERWGHPSAIVADRWREAELREKLEAVQFPVTALSVRGMGYRDGGEDVRGFRSACLRGVVKVQRSLLLRSAMAEARVVGDPAGNWKLAKGGQGGRRNSARDDAAAAAILAVAEGSRRKGAPRRRFRYVVAG